MKFIGFLLGAIAGALVGGFPWAFFLSIIGAIAGAALSGRDAGSAANDDAAHTDRLVRLEVELALLQEEVAALRMAVNGRPPVADGAAPVVPDLAPAVAPVAEAAPATDAVLNEAPVTEIPPPVGGLLEPAVDVIEDCVVAPPAAAPEMPTLWARILEGNPLAKIGVVLLFFGVASGLRLAVEHGWLPVPVRLALATLTGLGLIAFGLRRVAVADPQTPARRHFGLAIQGGGFALLYLVVYFMLARYALLSQVPAFGLFAALGVACVVLAARQDGPMLAVFGLAGAFLAPLLAGGEARTPVPLFTYLALINVFILAVDWFRAWRVLNLAGFLFTLAVGGLWATGRYQPEHYLAVQGFLILFVLVYSVMPVATLLWRAPGSEAWREGILTFGVPLSGIALQSRLVDNLNYAQAWSAAIAGAYYLALWGLLFRRPDLEMKFFERAHLGIAIALFTLAIPLAFDAQVTSAFWAAEGCAVLWFGAARGRRLAQGVGLLMQLAAGISFLSGVGAMARSRPVLNDVVIGGVILAVAGLLCARLLQRQAGRLAAADGAGRGAISLAAIPAELPALWGGLWWFVTGLGEIDRQASGVAEVAWGLGFVAASVGALDALGVRWRWPALRHATLLLPFALVIGALQTIDRAGHPLAGAVAVLLPLALAVHYLLLRRHEQARAAGALPAVFFAEFRHLVAFWLVVGVLGWEVAWLAERAAPTTPLWPWLAWGLAGAGALAASGAARRRPRWPWSALPGLYRTIGEPPVAIALVLWFLYSPIVYSGGGTGLPYLPILNPLDLVAATVLVVLWRLAADFGDRRLPLVVGVLGYYWVTSLAGRIAHHWGGVPWNAHALWQSSLAQALVTVLWTLTAIAAMIVAARRGARSVWMAGMALLGVVGLKLLLIDLADAGSITWTASLIGVALLLLAAAYFAPAPPKAPAREGVGNEGTATTG